MIKDSKHLLPFYVTNKKLKQVLHNNNVIKMESKDKLKKLMLKIVCLIIFMI